MHYHSKNAKTKKKKINDVMMTSLSSPWVEQIWRRKKKFGQKLCNFQRKQSVFHPQTLIHQFWQKNCTKMHKWRTIRNPNSRNPINWVPKNQKNDGFSFKRCFLQLSNINLASKQRINIKQKKTPKLASKTKRKPQIIQTKLQLKCHPWWLWYQLLEKFKPQTGSHERH